MPEDKELIDESLAYKPKALWSNKRFWRMLIIALILAAYFLLIAILDIRDMYKEDDDFELMAQEILSVFLGVLIIIPAICLGFGALIGIFKFRENPYPNRLFNASLITFIVVMVIFNIAVTLFYLDTY